MIARQVGEHLGHHRGDLAAGLDKIVGQPLLVEDADDIVVFGERAEIECGAHWGAKQQVLG